MMLLGFGDMIDDTDPCTLNPNDPICQAFGPNIAKDPCVVNPSQPFCQQSIAAQFPDPAASVVQANAQASIAANALNPAGSIAASLPTSMGWWLALYAILGLGVYFGGYEIYKHVKRSRKS